MVRTWQGLLPEIPLTEETRNGGRFDGFDISFIKNIEALPFFEDKDIFYHCQNFESIWNDFKIISKKYSLDKQALFDSIKEDINRKLIFENFKIESEIESGFYVSVFRELIIKAKNKNSGYDYFPNELIRGNIKTNQIYYCKTFEGGNPDVGNCHLLATTNELDKIK
jgi:hypothetical protein